jgi:ferredoxin-NADP reductase
MNSLSFQNQKPDGAIVPAPSNSSRWLLGIWRWVCRVALVQPSLLSYLEPLIRLLKPGFRAHLSQATVVDIQNTGHFIHLTLKPGQRWRGFEPGQHLQLVLEMNGRAVSRTFSISSSLQQFQQQRQIQLTIQQQPQGQLTSQLMRYLTSDALQQHRTKSPIVHISAASGDFVMQPQLQPMLLMAAGSGITPIHAMLTSMTRLTQPTLLIYSYRGAESLLFADSWRALEQRFPLLQILLIDTRCRPRLDRHEVAAWLSDRPGSLIYLCGPTSFSQCWLQHFSQIQISPTQIRQESFGQIRFEQHEQQQASHPVTVLQGAQPLTIQSSAGTLLQNLEAGGLQPTYGCRRGICMQCLCEKQQGIVRNLLTGAISDAGAAQIQLCISQPLSAVTLKLGGAVSAP